MSPAPASPHLHPAEALATFLRTVERRAWILASALAGDEAANAALVAAMRDLRAAHAGLPAAHWPRRFWGALLASPALRHGALPPIPGLAQLLPAVAEARGLRALLLVALFTGMDEDASADVLGLARTTHRDALARLRPKDVATAAALADYPHAALHALEPARLAHIARLREAVLAGDSLASLRPTVPAHDTMAGGSAQAGAGARWASRGAWGVAIATGLACVATFLPWQQWRDARIHPAIDARPLAAAAPAAQRYDADFARATDPDNALLLQLADGGDAAVWRDLEFLAWHAAQRASVAVDAHPPALPEVAETAASLFEAGAHQEPEAHAP